MITLMTENDSKSGPITFPQGTVIFNEGDEGGGILIIRSGFVEVFRKRHGREFPLARLGKDELLGVMTATTGGTRTATVRAETDVSAVLVPKNQVASFLKELPVLGHAIIK